MDDKTVIRFPNDNTVIRPRPGGKRQAISHANDKTQVSFRNRQTVASPRPIPAESKRIYSQSSCDIMADYRPMPKNASDPNEDYTSTNAHNELVYCASTLLSMMIKLSSSVMHNDIPSLKYKLQDEIKHFEIDSGRAGIANDKILQARYVLCTSLDEIVVSTPWGKESDWSQQSLLSLFHGETWGGEKFYLLLERLLKEPIKNLDILELMYICMSLGFQGKYRVIDNGLGEVEHLREDLYRQLRSLKNDFNKELSSHWHGVSDRRGALIRYVPLWVVGALSGVILLAMFSSFSYMLDQSSTPVINEIIKLGPNVSSEQALILTEDNELLDDSNSGTERLVKPAKRVQSSLDKSLNNSLNLLFHKKNLQRINESMVQWLTLRSNA